MANVIMDTGSSTLAVTNTVYNAAADQHLTATPLAQDVIYGTGGWTGPVVQTSLTMGPSGQAVTLTSFLAITDEQEADNFGQADGILGLAYNTLNNAYNLSTYLQERNISPATTYPWPFPVHNLSAAVQQFGTFLERMPQQDLPPYFTALEAAGVVKNIFAFSTRRSMPSMRTPDPLTDPLNNGVFVMGGGPEETDLFTGQFVSVNVVDDDWYNTNLLAVRVGTQAPVNADPLPAQYGKTMLSNSIVDSGTNSLFLSTDVYQAVVAGLTAANATFGTQIQAATSQGAVPASGLDLAAWPDITFVLEGPANQEVSLTVAPSTYWQVDAPSAGQAAFVVYNSNGYQSILGLPLLNNYFTVFDRSENPYGVIQFAPLAPLTTPAPTSG